MDKNWMGEGKIAEEKRDDGRKKERKIAMRRGEEGMGGEGMERAVKESKGEGEDQDAAARAPLELTPSGLRFLSAGITSVCHQA